MKKIAILIVILTVSVSCKKKYNCLCTTTILFVNSQEGANSTNSAMTEKTTEKQAKSICDHEAGNITATYNSNFAQIGYTAADTPTVLTNCSLE